jgi:hypothetical protein
MQRSLEVTARWLAKAGLYVALGLLAVIPVLGLYCRAPWYVALLLYLAAIGSFSVYLVKNWNNPS